MKLYLLTGAPFGFAMREKLRLFLASVGLAYDPGVGFSAALMEDDEIVATGSLDGCTVKCVAVSPAHQGEDLTAKILTILLQEAARAGISHLMLYTKPQNQHLFAPLGFHPVIRTRDVLLMENRPHGLEDYLRSLASPADAGGPVGCIVAHADPFTLGHRYLAETAAAECRWVHLFILSEDKGLFAPDRRLSMARQALCDLPNVLIHPTGPYMVSSATFPSYFLKAQSQAPQAHCELDVRLFAGRIAPALRITRRYVGSEPLCPVTAQYNARMKALLPAYGVELIEVERIRADGGPISASRVRQALSRGDDACLEALLPPGVLSAVRQDHA